MAPWSRDGPELPEAAFKKAKTKVERDNLIMILKSAMYCDVSLLPLLPEVQAGMRQTGDRLRTHSSQQPTSKPAFSFSSPARIWRLVFATLSLSPSSIQLHNNEGGQRRRMQNKCHCRQPYYCQSVYGRGNVQKKTVWRSNWDIACTFLVVAFRRQPTWQCNNAVRMTRLLFLLYWWQELFHPAAQRYTTNTRPPPAAFTKTCFNFPFASLP